MFAPRALHNPKNNTCPKLIQPSTTCLSKNVQKMKPRRLITVMLMIACHHPHHTSQQTMDASRHSHRMPLVCSRHVRQSAIIWDPSSKCLEVLY